MANKNFPNIIKVNKYGVKDNFEAIRFKEKYPYKLAENLALPWGIQRNPLETVQRRDQCFGQ